MVIDFDKISENLKGLEEVYQAVSDSYPFPPPPPQNPQTLESLPQSTTPQANFQTFKLTNPPHSSSKHPTQTAHHAQKSTS